MLCMHDPFASMKMADEHIDKRPRLADDPRPMWSDPRERERPERFASDRFDRQERDRPDRASNHPQLPPISMIQHNDPQSPRTYAPGRLNGYGDPRPPSAPRPPYSAAQYAPPPISQPEPISGVKRESGSSNGMPWATINNPKSQQPYQSHSPMTAKNGHHQNSPQSYTSPPSYENSNGNSTGNQPYPSQPVGIQSPSINITPRQSFDQHVDQQPIQHSADGIYSSHNVFAIPTPTVGKKKAQRASQACDSCRSLKAKCDEAKPCQSCLEKGIQCTYRQPEPKAQDKLQSQMSSNIENILEIVTEMRTKINILEVKLNTLEKSSGSPYESKPLMKEESNGIKTSSSPPERKGSQDSEASIIVKPTDPDPGEADASDEEAADPINPNRPKFGDWHTTGAYQLLRLPAISYLVEDEVQKGRVNKGKGAQIDRSLWKDEKRRGPIRQHGFGEGSKIFDPNSSQTFTSISTSSSEASSPATIGDYPFGPVAVKLPSNFQYEHSVRKLEGADNDDPVGGIEIDGSLDVRAGEVRRLVKIYMDKMNRLHPILEIAEVDRLVKQFLSETDQTSSERHYMNPKQFLYTDKKLDGDPYSQTSNNLGAATAQSSRKVPQRSPGNAVVLMMLALGKICDYKGKKLPEVTWGSENMSDSEVAQVRGRTTRSSSPSSPISSAQPSPQAQQNGSATCHTPVGAEKPALLKPGERSDTLKNRFVLPGLGYLSLATDIIGNEISGSTVLHIQANILAALYFGQLIRPKESHAYLHLASRAIQEEIRLKSSLINMAPGYCKPKDNPLVYAFWSCLQLECDIVAELPCLHSGILGYEELMPWPNTVYSVENEGMPAEVAFSYDAQLWLRKHLNDIMAEYNPADPRGASLFKRRVPLDIVKIGEKGYAFGSVEAVEKNRLIQFQSAPWKAAIAMNWVIDPEDGKSPNLATDILDARLRAKFYGARVITYRPFVQAILKFSWDLQHSSSESDNGNIADAAKVDLNSLPGIVWQWEEGYPRKYEGPANAPMKHKVVETYGSDHWKFFERGIRALINSTTAFHGMETKESPRLIVTNVFGTAHAQWGNVITLLACFNDAQLNDVLFKYITRDDFKFIVKKTVRFMECHSHRWSGIQTSVKILRAAVSKSNLLKEAEMVDTPTSTSNLSFNSNNMPSAKEFLTQYHGPTTSPTPT